MKGHLKKIHNRGHFNIFAVFILIVFKILVSLCALLSVVFFLSLIDVVF